MRNIAVILAGGAGKRFGGDRPKQFLPLNDGRSVLEHAVRAFRHCPAIHTVIVVMHRDWMDEPLVQSLEAEGVTFVPGGRERWESSWNALRYIRESLDEPDANILIHDAARPFVSERIILDVCHALEAHEAVTVAVPATDTIYEVVDGMLTRIPNRSTMMRAQTPQAFRLCRIRQAYETALHDPLLQATDDCGILHRYLPAIPIFIVPGDEANRKITFPSDLPTA